MLVDCKAWRLQSPEPPERLLEALCPTSRCRARSRPTAGRWREGCQQGLQRLPRLRDPGLCRWHQALQLGQHPLPSSWPRRQC